LSHFVSVTICPPANAQAKSTFTTTTSMKKKIYRKEKAQNLTQEILLKNSPHCILRHRRIKIKPWNKSMNQLKKVSVLFWTYFLIAYWIYINYIITSPNEIKSYKIFLVLIHYLFVLYLLYIYCTYTVYITTIILL
jgi:hypothetical protein